MHVLDFEFGDMVRIGFTGSEAIDTAPDCAVIGLQTAQLHQLLIQGKVEGFSVFLQPAALYLLFGLPVTELTNRHYEASGLMGSAVSELHQSLGTLPTFATECTWQIGFSNRFRNLLSTQLSKLRTRLCAIAENIG